MIVKNKHFYTKFENLTREEMNTFIKDFEIDVIQIDESDKLLWIKIFKEGVISFLFISSVKEFKVIDIEEYSNNTFKINFFKKVIKDKYAKYY